MKTKHIKGKKLRHRAIVNIAGILGQPSEGYQHRKHRTNKQFKESVNLKKGKINKLKEKDFIEDIKYYGN